MPQIKWYKPKEGDEIRFYSSVTWRHFVPSKAVISYFSEEHIRKAKPKPIDILAKTQERRKKIKRRDAREKCGWVRGAKRYF